ncbi:MAG: T9SS type A sorting domain-containing protein [bacterium]
MRKIILVLVLFISVICEESSAQSHIVGQNTFGNYDMFNAKQNHTVQVVQLDSTAKGCYYFVFTDCLGHLSYDTICMSAHPKVITGGVDGSEATELSLDAINPNPFSKTTRFTVTFAEFASAKLYLYDELGKEVAKIIDGMMPAGKFNKDFDGSSLSAGTYFARLECNGKVISKRVVIAR